jgi:ribose transport system permease protein
VKKHLPLLASLAPLGGLVLLVAFFAAATRGDILQLSNLQSLFDQIIVTALVTTGAVFVFGGGDLDMSMGACVCISAVLGALVAISTGSLLLAFVVCMGVAVGTGLLKGLFAAFVEVPLFIVSIVLGMVITASALVVLGNEATLYLANATPPIPALSFNQMSLVDLGTLGGYFAMCWMLFDFRPLGKAIRFFGGNPAVARQTGFQIRRTKILSFLIAGIGVGLAAFIVLVRVRTVGSTTATSLGTDVLIALVLGGMPISGGPRSKISAGLIGAGTIAVLTNGLTMMGLSVEVIQTFRGVIFTGVVFLASMSYRTKLLPR